MAPTAAHLLDHVIPHVPVRQWVLSLPIPLRLLLAAQPKLLTPVLQVFWAFSATFMSPRRGRHDLSDAGALLPCNGWPASWRSWGY